MTTDLLNALFPSRQWHNTPLPADMAIHPDSDTSVALLLGELNRQNTWTDSAGVKHTATEIPWIETTAWTTYLHEVPPDQPLTPFTLVGDFAGQGYAAQFAAMLAAGVPLPQGTDLHLTNAAKDTDRSVTLHMPGFVSGDGTLHGAAWELWKVATPDENAAKGLPARWTCHWGYRMTGTRERTNGGRLLDRYTTLDPTAPEWGAGGTGERAVWGNQASQIPYVVGLISRADWERGYINHPIAVQCQGVSGSHPFVWPASKSDASARPGMPQGCLWRFPATLEIDSTWSPALQLIVTAMRDYGFFLSDTGGGLSMRSEFTTGPHYTGADYPSTLMRAIPWASAVRLVVGSDADQRPGSGFPDPTPPTPLDASLSGRMRVLTPNVAGSLRGRVLIRSTPVDASLRGRLRVQDRGLPASLRGRVRVETFALNASLHGRTRVWGAPVDGRLSGRVRVRPYIGIGRGRRSRH